MRARHCILVAATLLGAACTDSHSSGTDAGSDAGPSRLFADMQWAIRCEATLDCAGVTSVDVCGYDDGPSCEDGEEPVDMSCLVTESGSIRTLTFQLRQGGPSLAIEGAQVLRSGGGATGDCVVTVTDSEGTYRGACGSAAPSAAQPCQVTAVEFHDDMGNPTFTGRLFCRGLNAEGSTNGEREITTAGVGAAAASTPAVFRIANCPGLEL